MGLTVCLTGTDSTGFDRRIQPVLRPLLEAVAAQEPAARSFVAGKVGEEWEERLGSFESVHTLDRYAAHVDLHGLPPPGPYRRGEDPDLCLRPLAAKPAAERRFRHLIERSDTGAIYLPVDFRAPLRDTEGGRGSAGSGPRLSAELVEINRHLRMGGSYVRMGSLRYAEVDKDDPWACEKRLWAVLHAFAEESVRRGVLMEIR